MARAPRKLKFEEALSRLDEIVQAMESGAIGIEESIARYEEAMGLAAMCRGILDEAEQRIAKIQLDASGQPQLTPFGEREADADTGDASADGEAPPCAGETPDR